MNELFIFHNNETKQRIIVLGSTKSTIKEIRTQVAKQHQMNPEHLELKSSWYYPFKINGCFETFIIQ